jgi:DNA-binding transcriptional MerR regulator
MTNYSIKELERISGVKAHTIRIWEQRYNLLKPHRTETNIRYYSDNDLKKLLNIAHLYENGWKISKISALSSEEIQVRVREEFDKELSADLSLKMLVQAMLDMDEEGIRDILNKHFEKDGFRKTVETLIYSFLQNIGVMWQIGQINPLREHFASNIIKSILIQKKSELENRGKKGTAILFLPEDELHEIGLLYYDIICKMDGLKTIYLGQNLPLAYLKNYLKVSQPEYLISAFINPNTTEKFQELINTCNELAPQTKLYIGGHLAISLKESLSGRYTVIENISHFHFV